MSSYCERLSKWAGDDGDPIEWYFWIEKDGDPTPTPGKKNDAMFIDQLTLEEAANGTIDRADERVSEIITERLSDGMPMAVARLVSVRAAPVVVKGGAPDFDCGVDAVLLQMSWRERQKRLNAEKGGCAK